MHTIVILFICFTHLITQLSRRAGPIPPGIEAAPKNAARRSIAT